VRTGISENMPPFSGDPDALQQVFINLVSNARDAMALNSEGQERVLQIDMHMHKDRARVIFSDTGPGVPPSIASKLFDPFFTTKDVGRGTGLGLSISHGIVQKHRGMLRYEAPAGGGARFVVELPFPDDDVPPAEVTS
jgi:signal transduction histidine kinase